MGFYVLVIFDFDGDLNGIPCLFCWVYKAPSLWQSLRTSSQSAEAKLDDLPADLEIKIRFLLNMFIRDFIEILATKKKGDIGKKLRDISRGCHIIRDDWEPRKRMLMMMTTMAFQWRICRLGLLSSQDLVYDGSFVSYEMPSSIIQLRVGWRSWWWP